MIATVLTFTLAAFALGATGLALSTRTSRATWIKFGTYFAIVHGVLFSAALGRAALTALFTAIALAGGWELWSAPAGLSWARTVAIPLSLYVPLSLNLILFGWFQPPEAVAYVYLIVAGFDGFSQVSGYLWGKHALAPGISPSKTIEGALGGALAAVAISLLLRKMPALSPIAALTVAIVLILAAQLGDLAASALKRQANIKDFSALLPGHGGVLDRFDSLLFAATAALLVLRT